MTAPSPQTHPAERETPAGESMREAVIREMAESWDDFVSDTGCFPDDFTILPRRRLQFIAGRWAGLFADALLGPNGPIASELDRLTERAEKAETFALACELRIATAEAALTTLRADHAAEVARMRDELKAAQ